MRVKNELISGKCRKQGVAHRQSTYPGHSTALPRGGSCCCYAGLSDGRGRGFPLPWHTLGRQAGRWSTLVGWLAR